MGSIYLNTYYELVREGTEQLFQALRTKSERVNTSLIDMNITIFDYISSNYNGWLKSMDKKFAELLRSDEFLFLLSEYVSSLVDLRSIYRQTGYPVNYLDWYFDNSVKQMMSSLSTAKKIDSTSYEVLYTNGKVRLLYYVPYNRDQKK